MKHIYKNAQENVHGSIDCLILIDGEWVEHTQDQLIEYELSKDSDWADSKPCSKEDKSSEKDRLSSQAAELYLSNTDWYAIRLMDSGEPIPEEIKAKRQEARKVIK